MDGDFKKVIQHSNWGYWDYYDGKEIEDGTVMIVRWPDKTETRETVHVQKETFTYHDHGHEYDGQNHYAYVNAKARGVKIKLLIRNLYCKLVRLPKKAS